jgi:hypothetical protein
MPKPDLSPDGRAHLRDNATKYGDPVILALLDALEATESTLAHIDAVVSLAEEENRFGLSARYLRGILGGGDSA